jgi:DNA-directed RNA polymerase subunit RPC12/RpoP
MSEFKFACPVCGQHITAESKDTGSEISCPTCYRKIIVPQAPATNDPKFVVSASEANKPRPPSTTALEGFQPVPVKTPIPTALVVLLVLACGAGATLFALRDKILQRKPNVEGTSSHSNSGSASQPEYTGINRWTLDLAHAEFPDAPVGGSLHHRAFELERTTLTGSNLTFRVGRNGPIELGVNVIFFNRQPEDLSGKTAEVKPTDAIAPRVVLHWKEADRVDETFRSGYAMKVEFGAVNNGAITGKIFLCLPDEAQSWIAGTFRAEIRKPFAPRQRPPLPTQPIPSTQ